MRRGVQTTLDRALEVLLAFDDRRPRYSVDELAQVVGWPKSTVYRYVHVLQGRGLLERTGYNGTYSLGVTVLRLARSMRSGNSLVSRAAPITRELAERLNETVLLAKREGFEVVCLDRTERHSHGLRISFEPGAILPLHASAPSKVLLAWGGTELADEVIKRGLERYTPNTTTDPEALRKELALIRKQGYVLCKSELDAGTLGLAVPVWGASGNVVASLSVAAPEARTRVREFLAYRPLLEQAATRIAEGLSD